MELLAEEVVVGYIFVHVGVEDLLSLSLVSTAFKRMASDHTLWQPLLQQSFGSQWKRYQPTKDDQGVVDWRLEFLLHTFIQKHMNAPEYHTYLHPSPSGRSVCYRCSYVIEKGTLRGFISGVVTGNQGGRYEHASCILQREYPFPASSSCHDASLSPWKRRGITSLRFGSAIPYIAKQQIALWVTRGMLDENTPPVVGLRTVGSSSDSAPSSLSSRRRKRRRVK
ncbi:hypothetical protein QOT17_014445 [Balamuthia mandrillaris]